MSHVCMFGVAPVRDQWSLKPPLEFSKEKRRNKRRYKQIMVNGNILHFATGILVSVAVVKQSL